MSQKKNSRIGERVQKSKVMYLFSHRKLCVVPDYGMRRNGDRKREVESGRASENKHANTYTPNTVRLSRNANVMMCI